MTPHAFLSRIALQHSALINGEHKLLAVRLACRALPGHPEPDLAALMAAMADNALKAPATLMLPVTSAAALESLCGAAPPAGLWIEFAAELAAQPRSAEALLALHAGGMRLVSRGRLPADAPLAGKLTLCIDAPASSGAMRVVDGIDNLEAVEYALAAGASATLGWPVRSPSGAVGKVEHEAFLQVLIDVIRRIDRADEVDSVGALLDRSPTLSFRLLRYLNSPACGLRQEVNSVRHAIMLLGYRKLREWVALLLASAVETPRTRPLMQASLRRAFLMQELAVRVGSSEDRGDLFVCGMFSLLDRMLSKPMAELLKTVPLSAEIKQCLLNDDGPLKPYLDLARHIESPRPFDFEAACEATALTPAEVNLSVLTALGKSATVGD